MKHIMSALIFIALASLAACGGGGGGNGTQASPSDSYVAAVQGVVAKTAEDTEPQDVTSIATVESDDTEPLLI
jgi:hypothetical protein